ESQLYDLGCSTGNTLLRLDRALPQSVRFTGIDASADMLNHARNKLEQAGSQRICTLEQHNLEQPLTIMDASVVVLNLTLQFVRPVYRDQLITGIAAGLREGGCLILVEKLVNHNPAINRLFIHHHYQFKQRNGYSELEIAQKREALENVLIPYQYEENRDLLLRNGFRDVDVFFRWYNFCGFLALK
ncbi:MAG: methyltransferase domain-containing protein, partial [Methylococcaceae bacterium]